VQGLLEDDEDDDDAGDVANKSNVARELVPSKLVSELQSLADDPEKLKLRAAELAVQVKEASTDISGKPAGILPPVVEGKRGSKELPLYRGNRQGSNSSRFIPPRC
jgi:hypothetical protein